MRHVDYKVSELDIWGTIRETDPDFRDMGSLPTTTMAVSVIFSGWILRRWAPCASPT